MIPSIVAYICLAATSFEITSRKKVRTKRKEATKKRNSLDVLPKLKLKRRAGANMCFRYTC